MTTDDTNPTPSAPASNLQDPEIQSAAGPKHRLPDIARRVGPPTDRDRRLYTLRNPPDELKETGAELGSDKVLTDLTRFAGDATDFYEQSSPELQSEVLGFSKGQLRMMVDAGMQLAAMTNDAETAQQDIKAQITVGTAEADQKAETASALRLQLKAALFGATVDDKVARAQAQAAYGTAKTPEELAASLTNMGQLANGWMSQKDNLVGERLLDGNFSPALTAYLNTLSKDVKDSADRITGARVKQSVSQAERDIQDGRCLTYMENMMNVFNRAHDKNPAVPRMTPLATRGVLGSKRASSKTPVKA